MEYFRDTIAQFQEKVHKGIIDPHEVFLACQKHAKFIQSSYNCFVSISEHLPIAFHPGPLFAVPYALKDNLVTSTLATTASSKMLQNYHSLFDATVVKRLESAGAYYCAKTMLDELAMGGTGLNALTGKVINPYDPKRIVGGSSSGSAVAVALRVVPFAIGTDTGDSIRKPASYCGVIGFKPTWGLISRFGVIPFAPSLDHVGIFANYVEDIAVVLQTIAGADENDMTSCKKEREEYFINLTKNVEGKKIAVISNIINQIESKEQSDHFKKILEDCLQLEMKVEMIAMDDLLLDSIKSTYDVLSSVESISCHSNLDGIKYGFAVKGETYQDSLIKTRTEGFSDVVKNRFLVGTYCLQNHDLYSKAKKIRRLLVASLEKVFEQYDFIVLPSTNGVAPLIDEIQNTKTHQSIDDHLILANMNGYPSISLPCGFLEKLPIGVSIMAKPFCEQELLNVSFALESKMKVNQK